MLTLYQSPGVKSDTNGSNLDALFKGGEVGLIFNGEWATGDYEAALGAENVGIVAPITMAPSGKPSPVLAMKNIFLSANSKGDSLNAALAFLKYMSTTEAQSVFAGVGHISHEPQRAGD